MRDEPVFFYELKWDGMNSITAPLPQSSLTLVCNGLPHHTLRCRRPLGEYVFTVDLCAEDAGSFIARTKFENNPSSLRNAMWAWHHLHFAPSGAWFFFWRCSINMSRLWRFVTAIW